MPPFGKQKSEFTEKISRAAENIGSLAAAALFIATAALAISVWAVLTVREHGTS